MSTSTEFDKLTATQTAELSQGIIDSVSQAVVGKRTQLELVLTAILAGGHVLLEDLPGLGKTLAARSFAQALGLDFKRAQFTPDLLPGDLIGSYIYKQNTQEFEFRQGPVFTQLLLADEINRTSPKTQSALLEAMQEHQTTIEGQTFLLPEPFHVIATANPIEHEGTFPLPEAQLDRFLLRVQFGYPSNDEELDMLQRRLARQQEAQTVPQVVNAQQLRAMQATVEEIYVDPEVCQYALNIVTDTRKHPNALVGSSPRGTLAMITAARALAVIRGRDFVLPEDVKELAVAALAHRVTVKPELWLSDVSATSIVKSVVRETSVPDVRNS